MGPPQLEQGGQLRDLPVDKPASLLYYLAVRGDWVRRAELAYLYRPDAPEDVALANVRVLLHRARALLPMGLEVERSRVRSLVGSDVADHQRAVAAGEHAKALGIYRGPFLEGVSVPDSIGFETWLELQRADLLRTWRRATLSHGAELAERGDHDAAADLIGSVVAADPLDEEALQDYLRALFASGRRAEAKVAYDGLVRSLVDELGVEPLDSTKATYAALQQETDSGEATGAVTPPADNNLPRPTTRFHGRRREMAVLDELLDRTDTRLVTVTGLGGIGKSRLALEVASERLADHAGGAWFVELAGTLDPELLPQAVASALRLDLSGVRSARAALVDRLREKRALLVLDNFEHLLAGADLVAELLAEAPGVTVLVTSREPLGLTAESVFELGGLSYPARDTTSELETFDAVVMFVDRATRLSPGFVPSGQTLEAVAELTRRVEGMPLALELAATWTRALTVPELLSGLENDLDLLSSDLRDLPERQRSIRTVLDHSWRRLNASEQRALARSSVFRGGFSLAASEQIAAVHAALLYGLIAHSLVKRDPGGRFQVHELVRQFASEKLPQPEAAELGAKHASYYLRLQSERAVAPGSADRATALDELLAEFDNVRSALAHAVASGAEELLTTALPPLFTLHLEAGALAEFTRVLEGLGAEMATRDVTSGPYWLVVRQQLGRARMAEGDFGAAKAELEPLVPPHRQALAAGEDHAKNALARLLDWLGSCHRIIGDLDAAEGTITEALTLAEEAKRESRSVEDSGLVADVSYNLGSLRQRQGRTTEAVRLFEESLAESLSTGDEVRAAVRRVALGQVLITGGDLAAAKRHLEAALAVGRTTRSARLEGAALNALAIVAGRLGSSEEAEGFNLASLALARRQGQRDDQRVTLANLGGMLNDQGRLDEAFVYLRRAAELALGTGNSDALNQTYSLLGANRAASGDHDDAAAYFRSALATDILPGLPPVAVTQCLSLLANAHELAGRGERATSLRRYLLDEPALPPFLRQRIEAKLADIAGEGVPASEGRLSLLEAAAAEREALTTAA